MPVNMYIAVVPNRRSPPAILLREGYRENGKAKNRTLANLSKLPPEMRDPDSGVGYGMSDPSSPVAAAWAG